MVNLKRKCQHHNKKNNQVESVEENTQPEEVQQLDKYYDEFIENNQLSEKVMKN